MKKVLYMTLSEDIESLSGVNKKIIDQVAALRNLGYMAFLSTRSKEGYIFDNGKDKITSKKKGRIDIFYEILNFLRNYEISIIYIRKITFDPSFLLFLRELKKMGIKIYIEIPTYPYDFEPESRREKLVNKVDRFFRLFAANYVDYIITFSKHESIFNIPCINISNGISSQCITKNLNIESNSYNFISVSSLRNWHGIDRFIKSMYQYQQTINKKDKAEVVLNIVGPENKYSLELKNLVKELDIKNVFFHGYLDGNALERLYAKCQFGIGSLGRHRSGISTLSSLKNREYAAKGLSIIYSENDLDFDGKDFVYKVEADESVPSIADILKWYDNSSYDTSDIVEFSKQFTWEKQLSKIFILEPENV